MSTATTRRVSAAFGAAVLGIVLFSTPAMAGSNSGHTQSASSNGATQGASHSNPDGGGVDKPYPADGQAARTQGTSDWDGNNGCGNDDDREDDNNGHCGHVRTESASVHVMGEKSEHAKVEEKVVAKVTTSNVVTTPTPNAQVMGVEFERAAAPTTAAVRPAQAQAQVLGEQVTRGAALARTGSPLGMLMLAGLALVGLGILLRGFSLRPRRSAG